MGCLTRRPPISTLPAATDRSAHRAYLGAGLRILLRELAMEHTGGDDRHLATEAEAATADGEFPPQSTKSTVAERCSP
jgi:hypothetical protein